MKDNRKGVLFTLETFIAAFIVIMTLFFLYSEPIQVPKFYETTIKRATYDCLENLDLKHELRSKVQNDNRTGIQEELDSCINPQIGYNITLCKWSSGGGASCDEVGLPANQTVVSSGYWIAGKGASYFPAEVRIYGWAK